MNRSASTKRWLFVCACLVLLQGCGQAAEAPPPQQGRNDAREIIRLSEAERAQVLGEMRGMLESVEGVVSGLSAADMEAIAQAAQRSGRPALNANDEALHAKFPDAYLYMGRLARGGFDDIAQMARAGEEREAIMARLGPVLQACTSCHAAYQIEAEE
jgi:cytochrome c556